MEVLPTEILVKIIQHLPHPERLRVEQVCSRWRSASQQAWPDIHGLHFVLNHDIKKYYKSDNSISLHEFVIINDDELCIGIEDLEVIDDLISKTGVHIQKITFDEFISLQKKDILSIITTYCRNIRFMDLHYDPLLEESCSKLIGVNKKMHTIGYRYCGASIDAIPMKNWKSLQLWDSGHPMDEDKIISLIRNSPSLEEFDNTTHSPRIGEALSQCPNLKYLQFRSYEVDERTSLRSLLHIPMLNNLTTLAVAVLEADDHLFADFLRHCVNLRRLSFYTDYRGLQPGVIETISALPKLEVLDVNNSVGDDDDVISLPKVKHILVWTSNPALTSQVFLELVRCSPQLETLGVMNPYLDEKFFWDLVEITKDRPKKFRIVCSIFDAEASKICGNSRVEIFDKLDFLRL